MRNPACAEPPESDLLTRTSLRFPSSDPSAALTVETFLDGKDQTMAIQQGIEELRKQIERLRLIKGINDAFHSSIELREVLPTVFNEVISGVKAEGGAIWLLDQSGQCLECKVVTGGAA